MLTYGLIRLAQFLFTVFGVVTLVFTTLRFIPGDAASAIADDTLSGAALERLREELGLDRPLLSQYLTYLYDLVTLNFGETVTTGLPIAGLLYDAIPITLIIALSTIFFTVLLAIPLGALAAFMAHKGHAALDNLITGAALIVDLMPSFWTALLLLLVFSLALGLFPASGPVDISDPAVFASRIALPVIVLTLSQVASIARITRTAVLEVLGEDYIRTARSMGWSELTVLFRHALRNSALPIVTVVGLSFGNLLNGTVIVEFIFTIPGLGSMLVNGIESRDYQLVQTLIVVYALFFVTVNFFTDLIYKAFDPRVQV